MHTWVLILTLSLIGQDYRTDGSVSVHSVDGFTSVQSCLAAGNQWLTQVKSLDNNTYTYLRARALCVQK